MSYKLQLKRISQLPQIQSYRQIEVQDEESISRKQQGRDNQKRIHELQGSLKMMEKQYKKNLKEGFENKIKTFRMQAVIERKLLKQTIQNSKQKVYLQELQQKTKKASYIRNHQLQRKQELELKKIEDRKKVYQIKKQQVTEQKRENRAMIEQNNKQSHDRICSEFKNRNIKKNYFEGLRKDKQKKEQTELKRQYLDKIMKNKEALDKLKEELSMMGSIESTKHHNSLFVTI